MRDWKIFLLGVLVTLCAVLSAYNLLLASEVRGLREEIANRQQFINESVPLARVNSQIIQTLANMSATSNDGAIRDMLARNGVTFSAPAPAAEQQAGDSEQ